MKPSHKIERFGDLIVWQKSMSLAEGYGRYRAADFKRFLTIANASAYEVRSQVQLAGRPGYIGALETEMIVKDCEEVSRMLVGLRKAILKS